MIEDLFSYLSDLLYTSNVTAVFSSFVWGILSILLSPCHLSSIPLIVGFLNSQGNISQKRTFSLSLMFSLGILITIALIGLVTMALGRIIGDIGSIGNYIVAVVFFIVGLYMLGILKLDWRGANLSTRFIGMPAALVLGLIFGLGLGPCTFAFMAPILGVVFSVSGENPIFAIILLAAFALGHCMVIVLAGTLTQKVQSYLNWTESSKAISIIKKICGILIILGGIYMILQ